ncbi:MAG: hypothetical protein JW984_12905 [Deltaproteobacteria bacterium]|uniref:Uncharacterized protein n=1 Tax=Candidatus Zymogenus saltonus TaxID=2844893 RepID=A0A9D8KGL3_9DELT|nr:hypothetical protein [Candidatus Zymogenus saltonus]
MKIGYDSDFIFSLRLNVPKTGAFPAAPTPAFPYAEARLTGPRPIGNTIYAAVIYVYCHAATGEDHGFERCWTAASPLIHFRRPEPGLSLAAGFFCPYFFYWKSPLPFNEPYNTKIVTVEEKAIF